MQKISDALNSRKTYFGTLVIILLAGIVLLLVNGKEAGAISADSNHPFYLNVFFINYTFMGDGFFALIIGATLIFCFNKRKLGFAMLYSFLISAFTVQIIKNLIHSTAPTLYFEAGTYLNFSGEAVPSGGGGFPSGHTATIFAMATIFVLMTKARKHQLFFLLAAVLGGYSRIYLAQHTLPDIIAGSFLGTASAILTFYIIQNGIFVKTHLKNIYRLPSSSPEGIRTV